MVWYCPTIPAHVSPVCGAGVMYQPLHTAQHSGLVWYGMVWYCPTIPAHASPVCGAAVMYQPLHTGRHSGLVLILMEPHLRSQANTQHSRNADS